MGRREDEVREEMARDADIMRGLGQMPSIDDLRYYVDELNYAALADCREEWQREEAARDKRMNAELREQREFNARLDEQQPAEEG